MTAPPGLSQSSTPFVASWRLDIPHTPLVAWPQRSRPRAQPDPTGGTGGRPKPASLRATGPPRWGGLSNDPTLSRALQRSQETAARRAEARHAPVARDCNYCRYQVVKDRWGAPSDLPSPSHQVRRPARVKDSAFCQPVRPVASRTGSSRNSERGSLNLLLTGSRCTKPERTGAATLTQSSGGVGCHP